MWKSIPGYDKYEISTEGNIRRNGKLRKCQVNRRGYNTVILCKEGKTKSFTIHQLVAKTFIVNKNKKPCVNHKDNNKLNNKVENLEWCTHKENTNWARKQGRLVGPQGEKQHNSKLTAKDVIEIRSSVGVTQKLLAEKYGVGADQISRIINRKRWSHI